MRSASGYREAARPGQRAGQPAELVTRPGDRDQRLSVAEPLGVRRGRIHRREMPEVNSAIPTRTGDQASTRPPMSSAAISFSRLVVELR